MPEQNNPIIPDKEEWLKVYYSRIQAQHDNSFRKKDTLTNWSLTILVAFFGIYFGILSGIISNETQDQSLRFVLVTGFLIILGQFFSNSLIAYAYLRKFRFLIEQIDSYWITGTPTLDEIIENIKKLDLKPQTNVGLKKMIKAQLTAGFGVILGAPIIIWVSELFQIENLTNYHIAAFVILGAFVMWEIYSLVIKKYDKIKQPDT